MGMIRDIRDKIEEALRFRIEQIYDYKTNVDTSSVADLEELEIDSADKKNPLAMSQSRWCISALSLPTCLSWITANTRSSISVPARAAF
jgi:hypothetical protein